MSNQESLLIHDQPQGDVVERKTPVVGVDSVDMGDVKLHLSPPVSPVNGAIAPSPLDLQSPSQANAPVMSPASESDVIIPMSGRPGWLPEGEPKLQSVTVTLNSIKDLPVSSPGGKKSGYYIFVTVDSRDFKVEIPASGLLSPSEVLEFPLTGTTLSVIFTLFEKRAFGGDLLAYRACLPIRQVQMAGEQGLLGQLQLYTPVPTNAGEAKSPVSPNSRASAIHHAFQFDDSQPQRGVPGPRAGIHVVLSTQPPQGTRRSVAESSTNSLADAIRKTVSKKKRRWVNDGFDLDLTYITDNIIAMGYPSYSMEGVYRNNRNTIRSFFAKRHPGSFKVYNLCSERAYPGDVFEGPVVRYPFADHNACPWHIIPAFNHDVDKWLKDHPQHVAAIHCKAGKGRTGLLITCYLMHCGRFHNATDALMFYGRQRTKNTRGVTIPSQIRYVHYYERFLRHSGAFPNERDQAALEADRASAIVPLAVSLSANGLPDVNPNHGSADSMGKAAEKEKDKLGKDEKRLQWIRDNLSLGSHLRFEPLPPEGQFLQLHNIRITPANPVPSGSVSDLSFKLINYRPDLTTYAITSKGKKPVVVNSNGDFPRGCLEFSFSSYDESLIGESKQPQAAEVKEMASPKSVNKSGIDTSCDVTPEHPAPKELEQMPPLLGDVQLLIYFKPTLGSKKKLFQAWFNTRFLERKGNTAFLNLSKGELDAAVKDKKNKKTPGDLSLRLDFSLIPTAEE